MGFNNHFRLIAMKFCMKQQEIIYIFIGYEKWYTTTEDLRVNRRGLSELIGRLTLIEAVKLNIN